MIDDVDTRDIFTAGPTPKEPFLGTIAGLTSIWAVLVIGTTAIFTNARNLTPDWVDLANSEGTDMGLMFALMFVSMILLFFGIVTRNFERHMTGVVLILIGGFTLAWTLACIVPADTEGRYNHYTRRLDPLESQYEALSDVRKAPSVAELIRRAARDGRIDRGEAHDIMATRTYRDAAGVLAKNRRIAKNRDLIAS